MPTPTEWITVWLSGVKLDLSTASIVECDSTLSTLRSLHNGTYTGPFKIRELLDDIMYRAWCDVVLDRRNSLNASQVRTVV